jgi:hypothetical protein
VPGRLRDAKGGDEARFSMLMGPLGAKLVGRGSPSDSLALMQAVLAARGIHIVEERSPVTSAPSSLPPPPGQQHLYHQQVCTPGCTDVWDTSIPPLQFWGDCY